MNLYTFYEINDLFSYDKKVDRADNKLKKKDVYLYYREYIGFDKNCIENDKRFFMKSKFFEKNITVRKLVIIPYFFSILAFLVFLCLHDRESKKRLFMIPNVAFIIILLIIPYIISIKIPPITSCSDEYTTTLVDIILNKKKMHQVYILILICFNSALFLLVIFCSEVLLSFISNCKEIPTKPSISTNKFFKKIKTIDDIHFHIVSFIILQDGRIAVQGKYQIRIYNPDKNYKCENIIKDNNEMIKICQIDNGLIISLHEDNSIKIKTVEGTLIGLVKRAHTRIVTHMESLSNNRIAISSLDDIIRIWGKDEKKPFSYYLYLFRRVVSFCYIRKHNMLIASSNSKKIFTWNGSTFQKISIIEGIDPSYGKIFQLDDEKIIMKKDSTFLIINVIKCIIIKREIFDLDGTLTGVIKINDENILVGTDDGLYIMENLIKREKLCFNGISQIIKIKNNSFAALLADNQLFIGKYRNKK